MKGLASGRFGLMTDHQNMLLLSAPYIAQRCHGNHLSTRFRHFFSR
jgi:hypothetical protein